MLQCIVRSLLLLLGCQCCCGVLLLLVKGCGAQRGAAVTTRREVWEVKLICWKV
jgi:hypothetical protein